LRHFSENFKKSKLIPQQQQNPEENFKKSTRWLKAIHLSPEVPIAHVEHHIAELSLRRS
jgi:hypothetical protein